MRRRALVLVSLFAVAAGALSAQVTAKFRAERERLEEAPLRAKSAH